MTSIDQLDVLVHRADLDGLVRLVDELCRTGRWAELLELRERSRTAVATGRQLWPAATLAEYRLALHATAAWAALVLDEGSGRFTIGPLTEVVAQRHRFDDLRAQLPDGPRLGFIAHECALRGQAIPDGVTNPLDIPFARQSWEPEYCLAEYSDDGVVAPAPRLPDSDEFAATSDDGDHEVVDDPEVTLAVRQLVEPWTASSNGRAEVVAVEGTAAHAVAALGIAGGRLAPITLQLAMDWLAWAGSSGGAHGRRRGSAAGRFGAWWMIAALAGLSEDWPVDAGELGHAASALEWCWWDAGEPHLGWELQLAVADPVEGYAWAISAHDAA